MLAQQDGEHHHRQQEQGGPGGDRLARSSQPFCRREEEAELEAAQQPQAPDDQAVLAQALAEESKAKGIKAIADTEKAVAQTEQIRAETAQTLAEIPMNDRKQAFEEAKAIAGELNAGQPDAGKSNAK